MSNTTSTLTSLMQKKEYWAIEMCPSQAIFNRYWWLWSLKAIVIKNRKKKHRGRFSTILEFNMFSYSNGIIKKPKNLYWFEYKVMTEDYYMLICFCLMVDSSAAFSCMLFHYSCWYKQTLINVSSMVTHTIFLFIRIRDRGSFFQEPIKERTFFTVLRG